MREEMKKSWGKGKGEIGEETEIGKRLPFYLFYLQVTSRGEGTKYLKDTIILFECSHELR